jgi:hypothetical protein
LEDFRARLGEYPEAQSTIQEVEKALRLYKAEIGSEMERVQLRKAIQARRADGSVLEYGLEYHLGILNSEVGSPLVYLSFSSSLY